MHQDQDANQRLDRLAGAAADTAQLYFPAPELTASDNPARARQAEVRLRDGVAQWLPRCRSIPVIKPAHRLLQLRLVFQLRHKPSAE
jgi:hypothetical protein